MPERDCTKCERQEEWGCFGPPALPVMFDQDEGWLDRCPMRPYFENPLWFNEVMEMFVWVKRGFLPAGGTWRDQPAKTSFFLNVIEKALGDAQEELDNRQKREAKKSAPPTPARARPAAVPRVPRRR